MKSKRKFLKQNADAKKVTLDLHGYPVAQAASVADQVVRGAWEAGYDSVKLIHGAPDVKSKEQADATGRGGIKVDLRERLTGGDWSPYVRSDEAAGHSIKDGAMTLKLQANPTPSKTTVPRRRLPKPLKAWHFEARRAWAAAREAVNREHPVLAAGEELSPGLTRACRTALTKERFLGERLESMRQRNPDHQHARGNGRLHRKWEKARIQAESRLHELSSFLDRMGHG